MPSLQGIWLGGYNVPVPLGSAPLVPYSVISYWIAIRHAMQGPLALKGQRDLLQNLRLVTEADAPRDKRWPGSFTTAISRHYYPDRAASPSLTVAFTC